MKFLLTFILISSAAIAIHADIGVPATKKPSPTATPRNDWESNLQITVSNQNETVLVIPQSFIKNLEKEMKKDSAQAAASHNSLAASSTIAGGILLSLSFVFGGVFLLKNNSVKAAISLIILAIASTSGIIIYANAPPPPIRVQLDESFINEKVKQTYYGVIGPIKVRVSESGDHFRLLVPKTNKQEKSREE